MTEQLATEVDRGRQVRYGRIVVTRGGHPGMSVETVMPIVTDAMVVKARTPGPPTKAQISAANHIAVGRGVENPILVDAPPPEYPEEARAKGMEGAVVLEAVISVEGKPVSVKVIGPSDPVFSDAATKAVRQWRYRSALWNYTNPNYGQPVEVLTTITVRFQLEP